MTTSTLWKPASLLTVTGKDPNFTYRWVNKADLEKKTLEGWEVVKTSSGKTEGPAPTLADGKALDSTVQKRELILCRMPKTMAESRKKHFEGIADGLERASVEELRESAKSADAETYGELKILSAGNKK